MKNLANFNYDWKFFLEGLTDTKLDASPIQIDEKDWDTISIPHDWSINSCYNKEKGNGATAYLLGGVAWYRKHFAFLKEDLNKKAILTFDGIYNLCTIYLNGNKIGEHHFGYSPFQIDITNAVKEENVLAIKVDHSRYIDSRWYSGSGIYRKVDLTIFDAVSINPWTVEIDSTPTDANCAKISIRGSIESQANTAVDLRFSILNTEGQKVFETETTSSDGKFILDSLKVENITLWDIDNPNLYTLCIYNKKNKLFTTKFGIRSLKFDAEKGFFLNGKNYKIKGVCLHHDAGLVGAAVPKDVWKRRLQILRSIGCNAIRTSHNPQSNDFLDLCDELGFLVQEEFYDEWDYPKDKRNNGGETHDDYLSRGFAMYFQDENETELKNTIHAHYNHPSIFQWSIGNEIEWTYVGNREATGFFNSDATGNYFWSQPPYNKDKIHELLKKYSTDKHKIGDTAKKLAKWVKECDTTRPVIANCILPSASFESGYADALDIVGFSYRRVMYDYAKKNYPNKPIMGCENVGQYHEWKAIEDRDYVMGTFLWTGIDYMGEAHRDKWPMKGTLSGLLDFNAYIKPSGRMYSSLWNKTPQLYIATQTEKNSWYTVKDKTVVAKKDNNWEHRLWVWPKVNEHWNYQNNETIIVEVYTNCAEIELFLNNISLGKKSRKDFIDNIVTWAVPFASGTLSAKGTMSDGNEIEYKITTAMAPKSIAITSDKTVLKAESNDCAHINIQLKDKDNNDVYHNDRNVVFEVTGDCRILGCDNGEVHNIIRPLDMHTLTNNGKAMLIIEAGTKASKVTITAHDIRDPSLCSKEFIVNIK